MLRNYDDVNPLILSGKTCRTFFEDQCVMLNFHSVPEDQEVSIEFVVNSVVQALTNARERERSKDSSLAPFNINIEVFL